MTTTEAPPTPQADPLLGLREIATLLGVKYGTVRQWKWRAGTGLPEPDATVGGSPAWHRSRIVTWAENTGRQVDPHPPGADGKRRDDAGRRLCGIPGCPEVHRARDRCRGHYGELTGK